MGDRVGTPFMHNCQLIGGGVDDAFTHINGRQRGCVIHTHTCTKVNQWSAAWAGHLYADNCQSMGSSVGTAFIHKQLWFGILGTNVVKLLWDWYSQVHVSTVLNNISCSLDIIGIHAFMHIFSGIYCTHSLKKNTLFLLLSLAS